jgi:hypothetical protein
MARATRKASAVEKKTGNESCCSEGCCEAPSKWKHSHHGHGNALYGLGVLGAAVYFFQQASGFWPCALAILKAFFWPAFVVYKALGLMGF